MVVLLRFACMVKANNFTYIEDWEEIFKKFPHSFKMFQGLNSKFKIEWYLWQCNENLLKILQAILEDPNYNEIKKNQEKEWNKIFTLVKEAVSRKGPRKSLKQMIKEEGREEDDW
ncbi:MAG: hypothetical protein JW891_02565 [Candidatus Lokiarchaeota archaeon]|nr:hypothetical protein [Candidatus Lokiarchaeota archaeon]